LLRFSPSDKGFKNRPLLHKTVQPKIFFFYFFCKASEFLPCFLFFKARFSQHFWALQAFSPKKCFT